MVWSSVLLVRHASLKCSVFEHASDYSRTHEREIVDRRNADDTHPRSPGAYRDCAAPDQQAQPGSPLRPGRAGRVATARGRRGRPARPRATAAPVSRCPRPAPQASRPARDDGGAGPTGRRHHSVAGPGREFRARWPTATPALGCPRARPARPWCGWKPGESLQDVAARVAPDAPVRQVAERIRELNDLNSPTVAAGPDADRAGRLTARGGVLRKPLYAKAPAPTPRGIGPAGERTGTLGVVLRTRMSARRRSGHALSVLPASRFPGHRLAGNR